MATAREHRAAANVRFGRSVADAIFTAKGEPTAIVVTRAELAAICAVVADRVTESTLEAVTEAALARCPQMGGVQ